MFLRLLFVLTVSVLFAACSDNSGGGSKAPLEDLTGSQVDGSCAIKSDAGEKADDAASQAMMMQKANYEKSFQANHLNAVLRASGIETARYVEKTDVQLYRLDLLKKGCEFFRFLPQAPSDLSSYVAEIQNGKDNDSSAGTILGVYLALDPTFKSTQSKPAILVQNRTDRYTLVHEFMHHNFSQTRLLEGKAADGDLKSALNKDISELKKWTTQYDTSKQEDTAVQIATVLSRLVKRFDELMVRYTLEESAIEVVLGKAYESGKLTNVAKSSYINGGFYIESTAQDYKQRFNSVISLIVSLRDSVKLQHRAHLQKVHEEALNIFYARKKELDPLVLDSSVRRAQKALMQASDDILATTPCTHSHDVNEIFENFESVLD